MSEQPDFDRIAPLYRWLEYASLGPLLERTRLQHLDALAGARQALVLGDGDGRFTACLLAANPEVYVHAIDLSAAMLRLLRRNAGPHSSRLRTTQANALSVNFNEIIEHKAVEHEQIDLVVTHFFLDCLTLEEASALIHRVAARLAPGALWLVSEFQVPAGLLHWPARIYIRSLYAAFRVLTGLRVRSVPDFAGPLQRAGFRQIAVRERLFGLLTTTLWRLPDKWDDADAGKK